MPIQIANSTDLCIVASPEVLRFISTLGENGSAWFLINKAQQAAAVGEGEEGDFTFRLTSETCYLITYVQTGRTRTLLRVNQIELQDVRPEKIGTPSENHHAPGKRWSIANAYYAMGIAGLLASFGAFIAKNATVWASYIPFLK